MTADDRTVHIPIEEGSVDVNLRTPVRRRIEISQEPLADWERELICQHCGSSCCGDCPRMTAPALTDAEAATVARFEAGQAAEESLWMRIGLAIWDEGGWCGECDHMDFDDCRGCREDCGRYADAAIAVMRGESA